jgi:type IV secretory pathway TrbF-like protein
MATAPQHTPAYEDQLIAWHNQRLWWLLCGAGVIIVALTTAFTIFALRPHNTPYVIEVNNQGEPTGVIQPFELRTAITDNTIRWAIGEYVEYAFSVIRSFGMNKLRLAQVYAESTSQASDALTSYYRANKDGQQPARHQQQMVARRQGHPHPSSTSREYLSG